MIVITGIVLAMLITLVQIAFGLAMLCMLTYIVRLFGIATHELLHITKLDSVTNEYATMAINATILILWAFLAVAISILTFRGATILLGLLISTRIVSSVISFISDRELLKSNDTF